jgi:leucyl-tRNA synthetase
MGFSIDWRREFHTTSLYPPFSRFVEWQYKKLKEKNYVVKGTHPVVWCPKCESPTGDHDRLVGEGVSPEEYVLMKFKLNNTYLPAATFRPETIFGVTNLWINPEAIYVEAKVNGEKWIISKTCANKLKEQVRNIEIIHEFKGKEIIGKKCNDLIAKHDLLILPGWFVNPDNATGVVYSVPAHAPYDWLALRDLMQKPRLLKEFNLTTEQISQIKPISMIKIEEFGDYPAVEIVNKMNIKDQNDPKAEEATNLIYKKEFHTGRLKENCGDYAGKAVSEVKQQIIKDFKKKQIIDSMYDIPQNVICRCTTPCIVKILQDQWFLRYSDPDWKKKAKTALAHMEVYPGEARRWFEEVINWLNDWACARRTGLGTPLPWAPSWIVETLSDSTVYMAFYTINKHIVQFKIKAEQLLDEIFDYVFYGEGNLKQLAEKSGIKPEIIQDMRNEFLYWYPIDLRNSAKDLVPNHLTFFIFQHTALFNPEYWPKRIGVNGFMRVEGEEMHKSKGNFIPLRKAVEEHGADATRCMLLLAAENMDDPDWRAENLRDVKINLNSFYSFVMTIKDLKGRNQIGHLEKWLNSSIQHRIKKITESLETLKTRTAIENALYGVWNDLRWYLRRTKDPHAPTVREIVDIWIRLLAPFAPHVCEEIWHQTGGRGFVSLAQWPVFDEGKIDVKSEEIESLIKDVLNDTKNILKVMGISPKKIYYYTAAEWKWKVYIKILGEINKGPISFRNLMEEFSTDIELKKFMKQVAKYVQKTAEEIKSMPLEARNRRLKLGVINEMENLRDAEDFFKREFNAEIIIQSENDPAKYDPKNRSQFAEPYRPAIYIE